VMKFVMLALCQHLPCESKRAKFSGRDPLCKLCTQGVVETSRHIFECPRNHRVNHVVREKVMRVVNVQDRRPWYVNKQYPVDEMEAMMRVEVMPTYRDWPALSFRAIGKIIMLYARTCDAEDVDANSARLRELLGIINEQAKWVHNVSTSYDESAETREPRCTLFDEWCPPKSLLRSLQRHLKLDTIGLTSAQHVPLYFNRWLSEYDVDLDLGAEGAAMDVEWGGRYLLLPVAPESDAGTDRSPGVEAIMEKAIAALGNDSPTRILLLMEESILGRKRFVMPNMKNIGTFEVHTRSGSSPTRLVLLLAQNDCAYSYDPVDWTSLKQSLHNMLSTMVNGKWSPGEWEDEVDDVVTLRNYQGRCGRAQKRASLNTHSTAGSGVFNWFDSSQNPEGRRLRVYLGNPDANMSGAVTRSVQNMWKMDRYAGYLGILPAGLSHALAWEIGSEEVGWQPCNRDHVSDRMDTIRKTLVHNAMEVAASRDLLYERWWQYGSTENDITRVAEAIVDRQIGKEDKSRKAAILASTAKRMLENRYNLRKRPRPHDRGPYLGDDVDNGREARIIDQVETLQRQMALKRAKMVVV
jgi:hypothetical protein